MSKIDLLLVNPSNKKEMYQDLSSSLSAIEPPLLAGLIAGFISEKGFSVKIIDADAEGWSPEYTAEKIFEYRPLLVGIIVAGANPSASSTPKMIAARRVLNIIRNKAPYIKTFLYGIHPSALTERTLTEEAVDFVCKGECFYTVLKLLEILKSGKVIDNHKIDGLWYRKNNKIIFNGWGRPVQNLDELPLIPWHLLPMDKYRAHNWHCFGHIRQRHPYAVIYTSLGCTFNCRYCNIHALYSDKPNIRFRSPEKVLKEINCLVKNYNVKNIKILDELFVINEKRVIELCDLIIKSKYNLNMWVYARIDTVNKRLLEKMKQAGINWLSYGIESGNERIRNDIGKGRFGKDTIKKIIKMTHSVGIHIIGNFIFGLPGDNFKTMQETLNLAKELNLEYVNFYTTMAYPGSRLYQEAVQRKLRLPESWLGYSQLSTKAVPLPTRYLSSADILSFRDKSFEEYYNNPSYLKMIEDKFGLETVEHIKEMLKYKIYRKFA